MFIVFNMHMHACACVHAWDTPTHPYPPHPHPPICHPQGDPRNQLKFDISIPFEICEEFPTHGWVYGLVGGWVDWWDQV